MQSLLDVCYEYGTDNDILFNPIKSVCTVFKPKAYKRFTPKVFIGDDALKFTRETKYSGFTFNDSKCDDSDLLRQMRLLYAKSNTLLRTFSYCSSDIKVTPFQSYCTALYVFFCGTIIKCLHLVKFVSRLTMLIKKYLVFLSGVVLVQCMQLIIFVTLRQCYERTYVSRRNERDFTQGKSKLRFV